jgi:hypothetical protein
MYVPSGTPASEKVPSVARPAGQTPPSQDVPVVFTPKEAPVPWFTRTTFADGTRCEPAGAPGTLPVPVAGTRNRVPAGAVPTTVPETVVAPTAVGRPVAVFVAVAAAVTVKLTVCGAVSTGFTTATV